MLPEQSVSWRPIASPCNCVLKYSNLHPSASQKADAEMYFRLIPGIRASSPHNHNGVTFGEAPVLMIRLCGRKAATNGCPGRRVGNFTAYEKGARKAFWRQEHIEPFKAQWFLCVPSPLTFKNSAFCPHGVSVCSVWFSL
jgi:hypothetical protein